MFFARRVRVSYLRDAIARALYVTASGRRVMILRVFTKKTKKTPRREIELAARRAEEVT
jgi:phage-related protein